MKRKLMLLLACLFVGIGFVTAQTSTISGVVTSEEDGESVVGASVLVKGTSLGTVTGIDGKFTIANVPSSAKTLRVSFVGMQSQEVAIRSGLMKIVLKPDAEVLDEVVVTAMGISRSEKTLGYSATTVKSDEIINARTTNIANALSGKVAGVQVSSTSSDPGSVSNIVIRGFSSINGDNQPLYVVDGIPLQNSLFSGSGKNVSTGGVSNVASEDIESMTILKGAAATALYGSRAANGVIVITTKSGKKGDGRNFSISYSGSIQARQVSLLPDMQNEFGQGWNGAQTFIENGSWGPALDGSLQVYGPIWNHQQLIHEYSAKKDNVRDFFDLGWSQNHNLSLSGVSNDGKLDYYLSYSYANDDGIMPKDYDTYERNTLAFRSSYEATDWLKVSSSVNFARSATDAVGNFQGTSVIDGLYEMPRDVSIVDMKNTSSAFFNPEAYFTPYGITNPYWSLENNYNHTNSKQIYGKLQVDIKPIKELTLSYRMGFDYTDYDIKMGAPQIELDDALINEDYGYAPSNMNQSGYVYASYGRRYELNHDFLANYAKKFLNGKLDVNVNAGVNMNERGSTSMTGQTDDLTFFTGFWDLSNGATKTTLGESQSKRRLVGLFGDVTLGWDDMVYLNVTARNDWSSTLPLGKNSFFYPGATLSWIFTRLIPENKVLTFGKLRVAYGKTGNDAAPYRTGVTYVQGTAHGYYGSDIASFPMNGVNAFMASNTKGSSALKPEMTSEFEIGANLQFFNGRIGIDAAYYTRTTSDQIFTLPVDPSTGYSYMVTNFGKVRNNGIELVLNTIPIRTRDFRWDLDFNFSKNKNKVVSLPESLEGGKVSIYSFSAGNDAIYMYAEEGKPMGQFYTYLPKYTESGQPIVDANGQPVIGTAVEDTGKNMNNDWTGGVNTAFTYKDFTLSAALDIRSGGYMFSRTKNLMQFTGNGTITTYNGRRPFIIPNSVVDNGDGTYSENTTPIFSYNGSYQDYFNNFGYGHGGEAFLVDRSFVKLRNISLTWSVPKKWVSAMSLSNIAVTVFCNNVFTWTASDNYFIDPEATTISQAGYGDLATQFGELYSNPSCRIFGCNLSIKF
ncbi:MAG: SusC/RagA family TonB-linked outer membrane protein [Bacteroides sp.]|nr:SusC/RagA family TonB-linked outer membrane protein [Bacteroides sp.]MCD8094058.1 SusC/RagA family TonB-linked outer membrane protein [Bacteroides sp.]